MMNQLAIKVENVCKTYKNGVLVRTTEVKYIDNVNCVNSGREVRPTAEGCLQIV